jgi:hypothetical protein
MSFAEVNQKTDKQLVMVVDALEIASDIKIVLSHYA